MVTIELTQAHPRPGVGFILDPIPMIKQTTRSPRPCGPHDPPILPARLTQSACLRPGLCHNDIAGPQSDRVPAAFADKDCPYMSHDSFANRANLDVIEDYYQCWQQDPDSVGPDWRLFFEGFRLALQDGGPGPQSSKQAAVTRLISAYRDLGHFLANLDPL